MTPELEAHVTERQREIALLQQLYRFSPIEAEDFILQFGDKPVDSETFHAKPLVEQAA